MNDFRKFYMGQHPYGMTEFDDQVQKINNCGGGYMNPYILEERRLNVAQMDIFSRLMADRIIFLGTGVEAHTANIIQAQMLYLDSEEPGKDIFLYINSPGGSVYDGLGIYDTMQFITSDVSTMCTSMAASMGAVLLTAGAKGKRFSLPNSTIMVHQPMSGVPQHTQASDMEIQCEETQRIKKKLYEIMCKHNTTGMSYDDMWKLCDRDHWMTAEEAQRLGFIDMVIEKKPTKES